MLTRQPTTMATKANLQTTQDHKVSKEGEDVIQTLVVAMENNDREQFDSILLSVDPSLDTKGRLILRSANQPIYFLRQLVDKGFRDHDLRIRYNKYSSLHLACRQVDEYLVERITLLLNVGANAKAAARRGVMPLQILIVQIASISPMCYPGPRAEELKAFREADLLPFSLSTRQNILKETYALLSSHQCAEDEELLETVRVFYGPLSKPFYAAKSLPATESISADVLALLLHPIMVIKDLITLHTTHVLKSTPDICDRLLAIALNLVPFFQHTEPMIQDLIHAYMDIILHLNRRGARINQSTLADMCRPAVSPVNNAVHRCSWTVIATCFNALPVRDALSIIKTQNNTMKETHPDDPIMQEFVHLFTQYQSNLVSLKHQARACIVQHLETDNFEMDVPSLQLPPKIVDYIINFE